MKSKSISLVLGGVILCTTIVISTLFLNSPHYSLAARGISAAPNLNSNGWGLPTSGIVSGNIYYGSNGSSVYALNATTGVLIWKYHLKGYATAWLQGIHHGIVYISLSNGPQGVLYTLIAALQATNGSLVWLSSQEISAPLGEVESFQVVNGHIYFIGHQGGGSILYVFKASDGSFLWGSDPVETIVISQGSVYTYSYYPNGPAFPKTCALNANDGSVRWCYANAYMVTYVNGVVYANFGTAPDYVAIALNANDGSLLWSVSGTLVESVVQNIVYANNQNGIAALIASNGALLMEYQNASFLFSHNGVVYAVDSSNDLEAFKQSEGNLLWQYNFLSVGLMPCLPPMKGVLYCLSRDYHTAFALNATNGTLLWKYNLGSTGFSSPCLYPFNSALYCIGNGKTLFAFDTTSGRLLWIHVFSLSFELQMVLNGIAYVITYTDINDIFDVHLHAFNDMNGTLLWSY